MTRRRLLMVLGVLAALDGATLVGLSSQRMLAPGAAGVTLTAAEERSGRWLLTGPAGVEKMVRVPLPVSSLTVLRVDVTLDIVGGTVSPFVVDFIGRDFAKPVFLMDVGRSHTGHRFVRWLVVGNAPEPGSTLLRVFQYSGMPLSLREVRVTQIPAVPLVLLTLLGGLFVTISLQGMLSGRRGAVLRGWARDRLVELKRWAWRPESLFPATLMLLVCASVARAIFVPFPLLPSDEFPYAFASKYGADGLPGVPGVFLQLGFPNRLYLALIAWVHQLGGHELVAARTLNTVVFALSALPMLAVFRRFIPLWASAVLSAVFCAGPTSSYAAYFMPEATYFLGFWVLVWLFVRLVEAPTVSRFAALTIELAALTLVKPHATILVVATSLTALVVAVFQLRGPARRQWAIMAAVLPPLFYIAWFALAAGLAGHVVWNPAGETYTSTGVISSLLGSKNPSESVRLHSLVIANHLAVVLLMLGFPALLGLWQLWGGRRPAEGGRPSPLFALTAFAFATLGGLTFVSAQVTVELLNSAMYATIDRLHGRYYSFALPLLVVGGVAGWQHGRENGTTRWRLGWASFALAVVTLCYFRLRAMPPPFVVDYPEGYGLGSSPAAALVALLGTALVCVVFVLRPVHARSVFVLATAVTMFLLTQRVFEGLWERASGSNVDRMGIMARLMLSPDERNDLVVYAKQLDVRSFAIGLHLLSAAAYHSIDDLGPANCGAIPPLARHVLTLDPMEVACGLTPMLRVGELTLYERALAPSPRPEQ